MPNATEKIRTDPELKELLPALTEWEFEQLEMNILASPERVAVVVWQEKEVLLDGHNRYAICRKHKLPYRIDRVSLPDMDAAKLWVINEHLGRRHFSDDQKAYWMGKQYEYAKKHEGRPANGKLGQNDPVRTSQSIAQQHQVGEATIRRNAQFARDVDTIAAAGGGDARAAILARDIKMTRQEVQQVAEIAKAQPQKAQAVLTQIKASRKRQDTKRIVDEASRQLPDAKPRQSIAANPANAAKAHKRFLKIHLGYIDAVLKLCAQKGPVSIADIAAEIGLSAHNFEKNSIEQYWGLCPWLKVIHHPHGRIMFESNRYLRTVCEGRGPQPSAGLKAVITALGDLRREIDHDRKEAKVNRNRDWNPVVVQKLELVSLLDHIETALDKLINLG